MKKTKVLIVEDEGIVAKDIRHKLQEMGYTVAAVSASGEEAVNKAVRLRPDVVLMDIVLEGPMDGIQAAEEIEKKVGVPVIYLTAFADVDTLSKAKLTKPYGYIVKPFDDRDLKSSIEIALYRHGEEKAKDERAGLLSSAMSCAGSALIATDVGMSISFMNRAAEVITGWKVQEALKRNLLEVFSLCDDKTGNPLTGLLSMTLREGAAVDLPDDVSVLSKDGSRKRVLGFVRPIRDDGGLIRGIVTSFRCPASREHRHGLPLEILRDVHLRLTGGSTGAHVPAILKAVSFIEENLEESLTLDDIARAANMSKYHFTRLFKKHIGLSPVSFAFRLRIERAKQMLQTAAGNISEVSVSVGFRSINHFVKRFKSLVGMTPADYRELYK